MSESETKPAAKVDWTEATSAKITPEHIERARALVGYDEASDKRLPMTVASEDSIRLFAMSYGCDNPLYCDADYALKTRWGSVVAPGPMVMNMGAPLLGDPRPEAIKRLKKGLLKGIHAIHASTEWEWFGQVRPGDTIYFFQGEEKAEVKTSAFSGQTMLRIFRSVYMNQNAEIVCVMRRHQLHTERGTAAKLGKYSAIEPAIYTDAEIAAIDAIYAAEQIRGAEPRYWEDVSVGDSLGTMAKGPLTVSDIIALHTTGFAQLPFGPAPGRLGYQRRNAMPAAYVKNSSGIPDLVMRIHWEQEWALGMGAPMAYDYGFQREFWLYHYVSDWCGDDGLVLQMFNDMRKFNYIGDTQTITGEILAKRMENGRALIDVEARFTSQRNEVTARSTATIALPLRGEGPPQFPDPPADLAARAQNFMSRHHELSRKPA